MRLLKTINHPRLRISIFFHNRRFSVKAEDLLYQETITFREDEIENLEQLEHLIETTDYPGQALKRISEMHQDRLRMLAAQRPAGKNQEEDIL